MKLEEQVCSLELAKKLKSLGVKQESLFYWYPLPYHTVYFSWQVNAETRWSIHRSNPVGVCTPQIFNEPQVDNNRRFANAMESHRVAAFTVAELGEMLPREVRGFDLLIRPADGSTPLKWHIGYVENDYEGYEYRFERQASDKLADAMARMLIHLIEQGIVKP